MSKKGNTIGKNEFLGAMLAALSVSLWSFIINLNKGHFIIDPSNLYEYSLASLLGFFIFDLLVNKKAKDSFRIPMVSIISTAILTVYFYVAYSFTASFQDILFYFAFTFFPLLIGSKIAKSF